MTRSGGLLLFAAQTADPATLLAGAAIIAVACLFVLRRVDVRLVMSLAALALGVVAGDAAAVVQTFLATLSREQFVLPICSAMGFAYVLRHTGCDQHLVHLLVEPLRRVRFFLLGGHPGETGCGQPYRHTVPARPSRKPPQHRQSPAGDGEAG